MKKRWHSAQTVPHKKQKKIKYYAVARGRVPPTVYTTWEECQKHVQGYQGAVFQSFASHEEAVAFLQRHNTAAAESESQVVPSQNSTTIPARAASVSTNIIPQPHSIHADALAPGAALSTVVIQAGSSITISATAPTTITIHVGSPSGNAMPPTPASAFMSAASVVPSPSVPVTPTLPAPLQHVKPEHTSISRARRLDAPPAAIAAPPTHLVRKTVQIWFDGGVRGNPGVQAGAGAVVTIQPDDVTLHIRQFLNGTRSTRDLRNYTNNQAEYSAIVVALQVLLDYLRSQPLETRLDSLEIRGDSQLIVNQLNGMYQCKSPLLQPYLRQALGLMRQCSQDYMAPVARGSNLMMNLLPNIQLLHVFREFNVSADALANEAMDQQQSWMTRSDDGHQQRYPLPETSLVSNDS